MKGEKYQTQRKSGINSLLRKLTPVAAIAIVIVIFFNKLVISKLVIARGDIFLYFFPYWRTAAQALRSGRLPLWNPDLFMGVPFLANSQAGLFYPLNWPLWFLLPTHYALNATLFLHVFIAAIGTYLAGRCCFSLGRGAAVFSGLMFGLGGYLVAQVEHVNQIQGMAWLPWFLFVICRWQPATNQRKDFVKLTLALSLLFSLQLLSGHTQTFFITAIGLVLWLSLQSLLDRTDLVADYQDRTSRWGSVIRKITLALLPVLIGVLLAILISGIQLLPTLELTGQSSRQQGLPVNEVLSFSLNPLVLTKSLLPSYEQSLFSEYIALLPLTTLFLVVIAIIFKGKQHKVRSLLILLLISLVLAFGLFNPIYHLLARLPGFNLFRAPARWLILYALTAAMLAGIGFQAIRDESRTEEFSRFLRLSLVVSLFLFILLILWGYFGQYLAPIFPIGAEVTVETPNVESVLVWVLELLLIVMLMIAILRSRNRTNIFIFGLFVLALTSLFGATRSFSYADPTTPEAYDDIRPPVARLWVTDDCDDAPSNCPLPPARFLSLSDIFFDVGDQPDIDTIYADQLSGSAQYDYTIAIKQKEIIGPNLAMAYDVPSVDGFDGGVLPLETYTQLTSLLLTDGQQTTDGRLREHLSQIPDESLMDLFNARYVITDKVGDVWRNELFFDLEHKQTITAAGEAVSIGYLPPYEATEIWILSEGKPGSLEIQTTNNLQWILQPEEVESELYRYMFPNPAELTSVRFFSCDPIEESTCQESYLLKGTVLADNRDETFYPLVAGNYRLIHSGDVKIYENLDVQPRVFVVHDWHSRSTLESSLDFMRSPTFDPALSAVVLTDSNISQESIGESVAKIVSYQPERILIEVEGDKSGLLVLTDAYYPGWEATIDGETTEVFPTNGLFRSVIVPAGAHEVEFFFEPSSLHIGLIFSGLGILIWLSVAGGLVYLDRIREQIKKSKTQSTVVN